MPRSAAAGAAAWPPAPTPVPPPPDLLGWSRSACSGAAVGGGAAASSCRNRARRNRRPAAAHPHAGQQGVAQFLAAARPSRPGSSGQGAKRAERLGTGRRGGGPSRWLISAVGPAGKSTIRLAVGPAGRRCRGVPSGSGSHQRSRGSFRARRSAARSKVIGERAGPSSRAGLAKAHPDGLIGGPTGPIEGQGWARRPSATCRWRKVATPARIAAIQSRPQTLWRTGARQGRPLAKRSSAQPST